MISVITEDEFHRIDPMRRVVSHENARRFACMHLPQGEWSFGLSWPSDLVEPTLVEDPKSSTWWVGVDVRLACIASDGGIRFAVGLNSPLLLIKVFPSLTIALCVNGFLVIGNDAAILHSEESAESLDSVDQIGDKFIISLLDGGSRTYP